MSNSPEQIVALVQRLNTQEAKQALDKVVYRYTRDQIDLVHIVRSFIDSVELIQNKTIKDIPALLRKEPNG